ncbi:fimbrial protein [Pseudomonas alkylphenolica]|uniref:fimbrial protein n=1 Tax=Pseudomonas alkylphenolica TaxID=237609 RepID=UPI0018D88E9E|nr:fimbrial protein [Pseudomonas alkylphenolica]
MKKHALHGATALVLILASTQIAMAADGDITFRGTITANTCPVVVTDLATSLTNNDVALGNITLGAFRASGDTAGGGRFRLSVDRSGAACTITDTQGAKVTFLPQSGVAGNSGQYFGLMPDTGVATGVAVRIMDATNTEVPVSQPSSRYTNLANGMEFTAHYIATSSTVTAGPANSKVSFSVAYD